MIVTEVINPKRWSLIHLALGLIPERIRIDINCITMLWWCSTIRHLQWFIEILLQSTMLQVNHSVKVVVLRNLMLWMKTRGHVERTYIIKILSHEYLIGFLLLNKLILSWLIFLITRLLVYSIHSFHIRCRKLFFKVMGLRHLIILFFWIIIFIT